MNISYIATLYRPFFTQDVHGYKVSEINIAIFPLGGTFQDNYSTQKPTAFTEYQVEIGDIIHNQNNKKYYKVTKRQAWTKETEYLFFELDIEEIKEDSS